MDEQAPRRDRPWSKPERESAPTWPAQSMSLFVWLLGLFFVGALVWAGREYFVAVGPKVLDHLPKLPEVVTSESSAHGAPESASNDAVNSGAPQSTDQSPAIIPAEAMEIAALPKGSVGEAARLFAKDKQQTAVTSGQAALDAIAKLRIEAKLWTEQIEPLLQNDVGRKIASNVELIDEFQAVMAENRPKSDYVIDRERTIREIIGPIQNALKDRNDRLTVPADLAETFDKYGVEAKQTAEALHKQRLRIEHIVRSAESETLTSVTLEQAIQDREVSLAASEAKELKEKMAAVRAETTKNKIAAEEDALRMRSEQEQVDIREKAEKEQLIARAKSPDVQRYLATFLAKSYFQPTGNYMSVKYERTTEELPVSYTRIESSGALDKSVQGLRTLVILASPGWSASGNWHDRPPWQFDVQTFTWSKSDQAFIQRAQDLLRELGPTLKELKMLAP